VSLRRFCTLPAADRLLLVHAAVLHVVALAAIRVLPLDRAARLLVGLADRLPSRSAVSGRAPWAIGVVTARGRLGTCLSRALTTRALMLRHGEHARVHIGVALDGSRMRAHAWVESAPGSPGDPPAGFRVLTTL